MRCSSFQSLIQCFFTDRLQKQLGASPYTVAAYRDAFRLLLRFASERLGRAPSELRVEDLDAAFLGKFLENLEHTRGNCARTRNNRLATLHAFFQYVAVSEPALALHCQRILAIPSKRYERHPVEFITEEESNALVAAPDPTTWIGRRTERSCCLLYRRAYAIARSHRSAVRTWNLVPALTSAASEKAARCDARLCVPTSPQRSNNGCRSRAENLKTLSFRVRREVASAQTHYSSSFCGILPQHVSAAHRWHPRQ